MDEMQQLEPVETRYYNAVLTTTRDLLAEHFDLYKDNELALKFSELHGGLNVYSTITYNNAHDFWVNKIRSDEQLFRFVQRASTASRFLASLTWAEWSVLCVQLAMAIHPGERAVYHDSYIEDCIAGGGNLSNGNSDNLPAIDKIIVDRTDIKATYTTLVNAPWLTWLYVVGMVPIQMFEIRRKTARSGSVR